MNTTHAPRRLELYLSVESIWTAIGFEALRRMLARHAVAVDVRPIPLAELFARTGGTPFRQRHVARQRYRDFEVQRWCALRGVTLDLGSPHFPPRASLADRVLIACAREQFDGLAFLARALRATWFDRLDIGDPAVIKSALEAAGLPASRLYEAALQPDVQADYASNLERAIAQNVFGAPSFVLDGEVFWGQDRIEMVDAALQTGRPAFHAFR